MKKVKNVRPGVLIIADARLRLESGEVLEVECLTAHMEQALSAGQLTRTSFSKVVLPPPLGPMRQANCPSSSSRSTSCRTGFPP